MANNVFANNREISCKSGSGNTICAFPDVCFTPPENPATPPGVPIPYPNTGKDSDTTEGTKHVKITDKEVMLKNKSYFKTSYGDEAGCAAKKGVITSVNRGKVYFNAWSMDVKFEGENVVRHLDITTHNHASFPGNSPTWPFLDSMAFGSSGAGPCREVAREVKKNCASSAKPFLQNQSIKKGRKTINVKVLPEHKRKAAMEAMCKKPSCKKAMKCVLSPYSPSNCCDGKTPHHLVPSADFIPHADRKSAAVAGKYNTNKAPCICAEGSTHDERNEATGYLKEHGRLGRRFAQIRHDFIQKEGRAKYTLANACSLGAQAGSEVTGCKASCLEEQLKKGHKDMKMDSPKMSEKMPRLSSDEERHTKLFKRKTS